MGRNEAGYYAILPANIRYDKGIPANAKLLYAEVTALCRKEGYCWATNEYFADLYKVDERTIERWIKKLSDKKYLFKTSKVFRYEDGTIKRIRYIGIDKNVITATDNLKLDHTDNFVADHTDKNVLLNNNNNEILNIGTNVPMAEKPRTQRSLDIDEAFVIWEEVMGYPLQANKTDRQSLNAILSRKEMDLDKLRLLVALVKKSQTDRYKRFSIVNYTDLMYKTNDLIAWAHEKAAQQKQDSKVVEV